MSSYLVERIRGLANVNVTTGATVTALEGRANRLETVQWREKDSGKEVRRLIRHVFLFIGADPNARWLNNLGISLDQKGFTLTGANADVNCHNLATTRRGVFAIGDVEQHPSSVLPLRSVKACKSSQRYTAS
jgi:thioredoxin reductase (NADPH)